MPTEGRQHRSLDRGRRGRAALAVALIVPWLVAEARGSESDGADRPRAIISMSPNVTEILEGIGAFDRVVAVSDYCSYPPRVETLPRVGGWLNTNLEKVVALRPDLIILTDDQAGFIKDRLDAIGLRTMVVPSQTVDDVFKAMEEIGRAVGNDGEAQALESATRAQLASIRNRTRGRARPRVLCVVDRLPGTLRDLYVATRGSYLIELIEIAGGDPLMPKGSTNYARLTGEALVALDPEVILDLGPGLATPVTVAGPLSGDPLSAWADLPNLRAVREKRVYVLPNRTAVHPSQFVAETARRIAELLHPEAFTK